MARPAPELKAVLPPGTLAVGGGLVISGLAYGFLSLAARSLGSTRYTPVALLWSFVSVAAPGLCLPLEQQVPRGVAARRVRGLGGAPVALLLRSHLAAAADGAGLREPGFVSEPPVA